MKTSVKLKIADTIIKMESRFPLAKLTEPEKKMFSRHREKIFKNFIHTGEERPHILIKVMVRDRLPQIPKSDSIFISYHFQHGREKWRLQKKDNAYIYRSPFEHNKQLMLINKTFDRVTAYFLPLKNKGKSWDFTNIFDFLQVLLINYFALHRKGIIVHGAGVKDLDGKGLLFAGNSGAGKTTTARLWHKHSQAMVLNDDRIIIYKNSNKFFIYGAPWHGAFSDYLSSKIEPAPLEKLFFIYHAPKNLTRRITQKEAFNLLYPVLFPTFWDKGCLENVASFAQGLIASVPCYHLGFVNDKRMIAFVRKIG